MDTKIIRRNAEIQNYLEAKAQGDDIASCVAQEVIDHSYADPCGFFRDLFRLVWNDTVIFIKWEPEAFGGVIAHLEMMSEDRVAFPISETGYRSHFCHRNEVEQHGGPLAFVRLWLEQVGPSWKPKRQHAKQAQLAL